MYKTELHAHSSGVSNCATVPEETVVRRYIVKGYNTLVLTNHLSRFTYKNANFDHSADPWDKKVDFFVNGYKRMLKAAVGRINVLMGIELRLNTDDNDYLIYGLGEDFMRSNPDIMDRKIKDVSTTVRDAGGLIIQAHPFRNAMRINKPEYLDGIEVYNGHTGHDSRNDIAYMWAEKYHMRMTSGTDYHHDEHIIGAGIETEKPIKTNEDLLEVLRSQDYRLIRSGAVPY